MVDARKKELAPAKLGTLKEHVADLLTDMILSNQIKPAQRLNEAELSRGLKISRAPIREALQQLREQGLVTNIPRRGMFVVRLGRKDIQQISELRLILEAEALRLCKATFTSEGERKLTQVLKRMEALLPTSWIENSRVDFMFHRTIWSLSGNRHLKRLLESLVAPLFAHYVITYVRAGEEVEEGPAERHLPLLEFVQGKSSFSADEVLREHLRRMLNPGLVLASPEDDLGGMNAHHLT